MDKKTEILDKAMDIISTMGLDELSMRALGEKCKLSKASLYNYFSSKEEVIESLFSLGHKRLMKKGFYLELIGNANDTLYNASIKWEDLFLDELNWTFLRIIFSLHYTNDRAREEYRSLLLMLESQSMVILSSLHLKTGLDKALTPLLSNLVLGALMKILEGEEVEIFEILRPIVSIIESLPTT